jgi:hypothetical protein
MKNKLLFLKIINKLLYERKASKLSKISIKDAPALEKSLLNDR